MLVHIFVKFKNTGIRTRENGKEQKQATLQHTDAVELRKVH